MHLYWSSFIRYTGENESISGSGGLDWHGMKQLSPRTVWPDGGKVAIIL